MTLTKSCQLLDTKVTILSPVVARCKITHEDSIRLWELEFSRDCFISEFINFLNLLIQPLQWSLVGPWAIKRLEKIKIKRNFFFQS